MTTYNQFVHWPNSVNKALPRNKEFPICTAESFSTRWTLSLQKAVGKFAGICQTNPPAWKMTLVSTYITAKRRSFITLVPNSFLVVKQAFLVVKQVWSWNDGCIPFFRYTKIPRALPTKWTPLFSNESPPEKQPIGRDGAKTKKKWICELVANVRAQINNSTDESTLSINEEVVQMLK